MQGDVGDGQNREIVAARFLKFSQHLLKFLAPCGKAMQVALLDLRDAHGETLLDKLLAVGIENFFRRTIGNERTLREKFFGELRRIHPRDTAQPGQHFTIERGRRNQEILKQAQYAPVSVANQVAIIYASTKGLMDLVPVEKARAFEKEFYLLLDASYPEAIQLILKGDIDGAGKILATAAAELAPKYAK